MYEDDYESFDSQASKSSRRDGSTSYEFIAAGFVPVLLCIRGFGRGTIYVLDRTRVKLGRPYEDSIPDIPLFHPREEENYRFSRLHATVDVASGAIGVTSHYREAGGVVVSGRPLEPQERSLIGFGDVIEILGTAFVLESEACALEADINSFNIAPSQQRPGLAPAFGRTHEGTILAGPGAAQDFNIPTILPMSQRYEGLPDGGTFFASEPAPRALPARPAVVQDGERPRKKRNRIYSSLTLTFSLVLALGCGLAAWMMSRGASAAASAEPSLRLGQARELEAPTAGILRLADLDGDGVSEILIGDSRGRIHALRSDLSSFWTVQVSEGAIDSSFGFYKTGPNEDLEIWVTTAAAELMRLNPLSAEVVDKIEIEAPSIAAPQLIRLDGQDLIVVAGTDGSVSAYGLDMQRKWVERGGAAISCTPQVVNGGLLVFDAEPSIRYLDERGTLIKKEKLEATISAPAAVVERSDSLWPQLLVTDESGRSFSLFLSASTLERKSIGLALSGRRNQLESADLRRSPSPGLAYFDEDDEIDCLIATAGGTLAAFRGPEFERMIWRKELSEQVVAAPALIDVTHDRYSDVLAVSAGKLLVIDGRDGEIRKTIDLEATRTASPGLLTSPIAGEFDGDGHLGLVIANRDGRILQVRTEIGIPSAAILWRGRLAGNRRAEVTAPGLLKDPKILVLWSAAGFFGLLAFVMTLKMISGRQARSKRS